MVRTAPTGALRPLSRCEANGAPRRVLGGVIWNFSVHSVGRQTPLYARSGCIGQQTVFVCIPGTDVRHPTDQSQRSTSHPPPAPTSPDTLFISPCLNSGDNIITCVSRRCVRLSSGQSRPPLPPPDLPPAPSFALFSPSCVEPLPRIMCILGTDADHPADYLLNPDPLLLSS